MIWLNRTFGPYWKTVSSFLTSTLAWWKVVIDSSSHAITASEYYTAGVLLVGVLTVYFVENQPKESK